MRWFFKSDYRSFYLLNATQFLGALNDNIFQTLVIYLFIHVKGADAAPSILFLAGAIFVIPFLLFSSGAGVMADRISKRTIIVATKGLEVVVMLLGLLSVYLQSEFGAYSCLFLMATQSALFGPSKYGIIPELVEEKKVSKANGSITSFTYLATILGLFLASFLTDVTNKNFVLVGMFCVFIAIMGLVTSFGIARTEPKRSPKKINPIFLYEIYQTLKFSWKVPHLLTAMFSSAFFLFIAAYTKLNIIPFGMQSLGLSEVGGGYLFLATAVGIALGATLAGQLSKEKVEPGISCIAAIMVSIFFFTLALFSFSLTMTIISLALLGIVGGGFLIPFDSFIQVNSPDEKRGQVIAAANFFSFLGVLLAAIFLYLVSEKLAMSAATGFFVMGILSLAASIVITGRLSNFFFPFFSQKILKKFHKPQFQAPLPTPKDLIILQSPSWKDALILYSFLPKLTLLIPEHRFHKFPWFSGLFNSIQVIPPDLDLHPLAESAKKIQTDGGIPCLFIKKTEAHPEIIRAYKNVFGDLGYRFLFTNYSKEIRSKRFIFFRINQTRVIFTFSRNDMPGEK